MSETRRREDKLSRWWFGGTASACAACFTHPLDLLKVHLQTQAKGKLTLVGAAQDVVKKQGFCKNFHYHSIYITSCYRSACFMERSISVCFKADDLFTGSIRNL